MKKIVIFLALIGTSVSQLFSNETELQEEIAAETPIHSSYTYATIGIGSINLSTLPFFTFGLGRRSIIGDDKALDIGLSIANVIHVNSLRGYANILKYIGQMPSSQYYVGLGASLGGIFGLTRFCDFGYIAPNIIVGKEFLNSKKRKRFFQAEVMYPLIGVTGRGIINIPVFILKYGIAF